MVLRSKTNTIARLALAPKKRGYPFALLCILLPNISFAQSSMTAESTLPWMITALITALTITVLGLLIVLKTARNKIDYQAKQALLYLQDQYDLIVVLNQGGIVQSTHISKANHTDARYRLTPFIEQISTDIAFKNILNYQDGKRFEQALGSLTSITQIDITIAPNLAIQIQLQQRQPDQVYLLCRNISQQKAMEKQAKQQAHQLSLTFENAPTAFVILDRLGKFISVNPSACEMLLSNEQALRETYFQEIFWRAKKEDGEPLAESPNDVLACLTSGHAQQNVVIGLPQQASIRWLSLDCQPITGTDEEAIIFIAFNDITRYKQQQLSIQQDEMRWRSVVENSTDFIATLDSKFAIRYINRPLNGQSTSDLVGVYFPSLVQQFSSLTKHTLKHVLLSDQPRKFETYIEDENGIRTFFENRVQPIDNDGDKSVLLLTFTDVTEHKSAIEALKENEALYQSLVNTLPLNIYRVDLQGRLTFINQNLHDNIDEPIANILGKTAFDLYPKAFADKYKADDEKVISSKKTLHIIEQNQKPTTGAISYVEVLKIPMLDNAGNVEGIQGIFWDISERIESEDKLKLAASVFTHAAEGIMITDSQGKLVDVNQAFVEITGYHKSEVIGKNPDILRSEKHSESFYVALQQSVARNGQWVGEVWYKHKRGHDFAIKLTVNAVLDDKNRVNNYVALFSDITDLKTQQNKLEHIAHFDPLTDLPNRLLLNDRLNQAMSQAQRRGQLLALAFVDLDGFKAINDTHGHDAGDQVLITLSNRFVQNLRSGDTIARLGGDEFAIVIIDLHEQSECFTLLQRLLSAASQPIIHNKQSLQVSASIGVSFYPKAEDIDADHLLRQADQAMYLAKLAGKNRYSLFDEQQESRIKDQQASIAAIQNAIAEQEFVLYYQPKVNMQTGDFIGVEALIRWQQQDKLLQPAEFLQQVDDSPLSRELGNWVIQQALADLNQWQQQDIVCSVSVNLSTYQLQHDCFMADIAKQLAQYSPSLAQKLELEIVETSALENIQTAGQVIQACKQAGIKFALDDFGTGYSSLTYLKDLPADQLKIDKTFVANMLEQVDDFTILLGVLGLAQAFHREVIAEGVETIAQGKMLIQLGCPLAQGFIIGKPMPASQLSLWLSRWQAPLEWQQSQVLPLWLQPLIQFSVELSALNHQLRTIEPPTQKQQPISEQNLSVQSLSLQNLAQPDYQKLSNWLEDTKLKSIQKQQITEVITALKQAFAQHANQQIDFAALKVEVKQQTTEIDQQLVQFSPPNKIKHQSNTKQSAKQNTSAP